MNGLSIMMYHQAGPFRAPARRRATSCHIRRFRTQMAWAHEVAIVASRTPGPMELIEDGSDGLLAPVGCARGLARIIGTALQSDVARCRGLTAAGAAKLQRGHSRTAVLGAYEALYRDLLNTRSTR